MSRNIAVSGIYSDQMSAGEAEDALERAGFRGTDCSMLLADNIGSKDFAHEKHSKAPEGAVAGAVIGIIVGGLCGWLVSRGNFTMPWLEQIAALGLIGAVLSGVGVGSVIGLIIGALIGGATPEYEAIRYEGRTRKGGVLLSVHCDSADWTKRAKDILRESGARDIAASSEAKADYGATEKPLPRTRATAVRHSRVIDEEARVEQAEMHDNLVSEDAVDLHHR